MTEEQKAARKESAEHGHIKWIKDNCLRTRESGEDYVFISYKSDEYEQVLDGIVYQACRTYGLKVYFDAAFDDDSDSWIRQFYKNMCSSHCKGMIAFLSNKYYSSYATLLEMMARKTHEAGGDYEFDSLFFLPVNLEDIVEIQSEENTGLGTERFRDGRINRQASEELRLFNEIFRELATADNKLNFMYKRSNDSRLYREPTELLPRQGEPYLSVSLCRKLMDRVCPKSNDNDGHNKEYTAAIHDKLVNEGFQSVFIKGWSEPGSGSGADSGTGSSSGNGSGTASGSGGSGALSPGTTLEEFAGLCEHPDFCRLLRGLRQGQKKQFFDYLMAALLRGCDEKAERDSAGWTYCTYAVSSNLNLEDPQIGASQFTWQSNCRKAVCIPRAGKLGWRSQSFHQLRADMTIGQVLERFQAGKPWAEDTQDPFCTRDNALITAALDTILTDPEVLRFSRENWPG